MNKFRLLIIDSSKIFSASARQYLLNCPYVDSIQVAYSINRALRMIDGLQPHYIIIDKELFQYNTEEESEIFNLIERVPEAGIVCLTLYSEKTAKHDISQVKTCINMVSKENFAQDISKLFRDSMEVY